MKLAIISLLSFATGADVSFFIKQKPKGPCLGLSEDGPSLVPCAPDATWSVRDSDSNPGLHSLQFKGDCPLDHPLCQPVELRPVGRLSSGRFHIQSLDEKCIGGALDFGSCDEKWRRAWSFTPAFSVNEDKDEKDEKDEKKKDEGNKIDAFDQDYFRSYNMIIDPADLSRISANPLSEEYVNCTLITDYGTEAEAHWAGAGCRYKGALGSLAICIKGDGSPSGQCRKMSFKVDTDKFFDGKRKIFGQEKFQFHGMPGDYSYMAERVSYDIFKREGVVAPQSVHAKLYINNELEGLYALVQQVDDTFTKKRFKKDGSKGKGPLYKEVWVTPDKTIEEYEEFLKEGDEAGDFWLEVSEALANATDKTAFEFVSKYFDIDSLVDATAINMMLGAFDDWRLRHNYYFYLTPTEDGSYKAVYIPWDYDRIYVPGPMKAMGMTEESMKDMLAGKLEWYELLDRDSAECNAEPMSFADIMEQQRQGMKKMEDQGIDISAMEEIMKNILDRDDSEMNIPEGLGTPIQCDHFTRVLAVALLPKVAARVRELLDSDSFDLDQIRERVDIWAAQINDAVIEDDIDTTQPAFWESEMEMFLDHLTYFRGKLENDGVYMDESYLPQSHRDALASN